MEPKRPVGRKFFINPIDDVSPAFDTNSAVNVYQVEDTFLTTLSNYPGKISFNKIACLEFKVCPKTTATLW